jgi:hypothetical protein
MSGGSHTTRAAARSRARRSSAGPSRTVRLPPPVRAPGTRQSRRPPCLAWRRGLGDQHPHLRTVWLAASSSQRGSSDGVATRATSSPMLQETLPAAISRRSSGSASSRRARSTSARRRAPRLFSSAARFRANEAATLGPLSIGAAANAGQALEQRAMNSDPQVELIENASPSWTRIQSAHRPGPDAC